MVEPHRFTERLTMRFHEPQRGDAGRHGKGAFHHRDFGAQLQYWQNQVRNVRVELCQLSLHNRQCNSTNVRTQKKHMKCDQIQRFFLTYNYRCDQLDPELALEHDCADITLAKTLPPISPKGNAKNISTLIIMETLNAMHLAPSRSA